MKLNKIFLSLILSGSLGISVAQNQKADWEQVKKFENIVSKFQNSLYIRPTFINKTDNFWYTITTSEGLKYYYVNPNKKLHCELFNMEDVLAQLAEHTRKVFTHSDFKYKMPKFEKSGRAFTFEMDRRDFRYDMNTGKLTMLPEKKEEKKAHKDLPAAHTLSPDSTFYIYAYKHNLYAYGNEEKGMDTTVVQLTYDGTKYKSYAKYPGESEMGHSSPNGRWLKNSKFFMIEMEDMSEVKNEMHLIDYLHEKMPKHKSYRYNIPGDQNMAKYSLILMDVKSKEKTEIKVPKWKDQYVEFTYDNTQKGDEIFFYRYKRTWDEKDLMAYNVNTGETRFVLNEVDKPYMDYVIKQTHFLNNAKEIMFRSERTGWGHFYLYDGKTGNYKRAVTQGNFQTGQVIEIDTLRREFYFYGFGREKGFDPHYYLVYKAHLDKPGIQLLTPENANHSKTFFSPSFNYMVDVYSTVEQPYKMVVRNRKGKVIMELAKPDMKPLFEAGWRAPERFTVKAADGVTDLYGVMWKPMNFDSTKTYPIISEVYPGPQFEYVPTSFTLEDSQASSLAQLGFIVIQTGHRGGTPMRGKAYHTYGYKRLRDYPLADDIAVIKELARRHPYINEKKAGMFGHSGGGFMSAAAICSSNFYTAAVACAGNHDNRIYNSGWIEMNNGVEEKIVKNKENPADSIRYKERPIQTNLDIAKNLKGHLLLVHGLMDNNVHPAHSFRMVSKFINAGLNFDMVCLPQSTHAFLGDENDFFKFKMRNHFAKYLLGDFSGENILKWNENAEE